MKTLFVLIITALSFTTFAQRQTVGDPPSDRDKPSLAMLGGTEQLKMTKSKPPAPYKLKLLPVTRAQVLEYEAQQEQLSKLFNEIEAKKKMVLNFEIGRWNADHPNDSIKGQRKWGMKADTLLIER